MDVKVQNITQVTTFGQDNKPVQRFTVTFMVGQFGPLAEIFDGEEFTPDKVRVRLEARAHDVEAITGRST